MSNAKRTSLVTPEGAGKQAGPSRRVLSVRVVLTPLRARAKQGRRACWRLLLATLLAGSAVVAPAQPLDGQQQPQSPAQRPSPAPAQRQAATAVAPQLSAKLTAACSSSAVSKPLRTALGEIAAISELNLWIDRGVDPGQGVTIAPGPKTVFHAIADAAQSVGLEAAAAGNVVLVGRPQWVSRLAGSILDLPPQLSQATDAPPIQWPDLTTPEQAVKIVAGRAGPDTLALPHDLWPAVFWQGVSPELAILLITAQFDLMPVDPLRPAALASGKTATLGDALAGAAELDVADEPSRFDFAEPAATLDQQLSDQQFDGLDAAQAEPVDDPPQRRSAESQRQDRQARQAGILKPLRAPTTLVLQYPSGPYLPQLRQAAAAADPQSRFRATGPSGAIELTGSPAAHLAAAAAVLRHAGPRVAQAVDVDVTRFSLRLRDAPACDVFAQLAATAGTELAIAPAAAGACQARVTLEVTEVTLRELAHRVAREVGATATWSAEKLQIDLSKP